MKAVIWMLGSLTSFSLLAIAVRELSGHVSIPQILFFRSIIGLICLSTIIFVFMPKVKKPSELIITQRLGLHSGRSFFHFLGQCGWFLGIGLLPLAEVFALEFTIPIWALLFSLLFLGERLSTNKLLAMVLGMVGVIVIVQPNYSFNSIASFIVLGAAIFYAIAHGCTKLLSSSDDALTILFYSCLLQMPFALSLALANWTWPSRDQSLWLLLIGFSALLAHYCMTKAMTHGALSQILSLDLLRLPIIALLGIVFYQEPFSLSLILGSALILLANALTQRPLWRLKRKPGAIKFNLEKPSY